MNKNMIENYYLKLGYDVQIDSFLWLESKNTFEVLNTTKIHPYKDNKGIYHCKLDIPVLARFRSMDDKVALALKHELGHILYNKIEKGVDLPSRCLDECIADAVSVLVDPSHYSNGYLYNFDKKGKDITKTGYLSYQNRKNFMDDIESKLTISSSSTSPGKDALSISYQQLNYADFCKIFKKYCIKQGYSLPKNMNITLR